MFRQHPPAVRVDLHMSHTSHARPLKTERESADPRKQVDEGHLNTALASPDGV
jgi:hypothetical protein